MYKPKTKVTPIKVPKWPLPIPYQTFVGLVIHAGLKDIWHQRDKPSDYIFHQGYWAFKLSWGKPVQKIREYYINADNRYTQRKADDIKHGRIGEAFIAGTNNARKAFGLVYACLCIAYNKTPPKEFAERADEIVRAVLRANTLECPMELPLYKKIDELKLFTINHTSHDAITDSAC